MRNNIRWLLRFSLLATSLLLGACAVFDGAGREGKCRPGVQCEFHGKLSVFRGEPVSTVTVDSGKTCVKLALSDDYSQNLSVLDGKDVTVNGVAFEQFYDPSVAMTWFSYKDRKLGVGVCDHGYGIYVESMRTD